MQEVVATDFSENLFWDVDPTTLDPDRHSRYVVARVLEHGTWEDWKLLCRRYGLRSVVESAQTLRSLDRKAVAFLCAVGHVSPGTFRCCTLTPSIPSPWNS